MEYPQGVEVETRVDTVVQIGCVGCRDACAFGMDGLEGVLALTDLQRLAVDVPYSVTEAASTVVNGQLVNRSTHCSTAYFNGARNQNTDGQCGEPCALKPRLVSAAIAAEKATNARGVATEHVDPM